MAKIRFRTMAVAGAALVAAVSGGMAVGQARVTGVFAAQGSTITEAELAAQIVRAVETATVQAYRDFDRQKAMADAEAYVATLSDPDAEYLAAAAQRFVENRLADAVARAAQAAVAATISTSGASQQVALAALRTASGTLGSSTVMASVMGVTVARNALADAVNTVRFAIETASAPPAGQTPAQTQTQTVTAPPPIVVVVYRG